jgi:benzodiazapine receptor
MIMKKNDYKKLILYIAIPLLLGGIVGFITSKESMNYNGIVDGWVFPIVWSILYILMGISSYIVRNNKELMSIYKVNLVINLLWPIIFFTLNFKVFGFFWILLLILVVGYMMYKFYNKNKISAYLLIPYLLWLIFASILNLMEII